MRGQGDLCLPAGRHETRPPSSPRVGGKGGRAIVPDCLTHSSQLISQLLNLLAQPRDLIFEHFQPPLDLINRCRGRSEVG
jgi:hypothetical protein